MGLTQKILLFTSLTIVALVGATLAYTTVQADRLARNTINDALKDTRGVWEAYQSDRYNKLKLGVRALANDPYFKPLVESQDLPTIADTLGERGADISADLFLVTDPNGVVLARGDGQEGGQDLSQDPLVMQPLGDEHKDSTTLWRQGKNLFHAVSAPMLTGGDLKGVLVAGYEVNQALADQMRKLTHCEIAFLARPSGQAALISVSTLGPPQVHWAGGFIQ